MAKTDGSFDPGTYSTVAERISLFYGNHPNGRIETDLINRDATSVTFKARVYRNESDTVPAATGWATEREGDGDINTVACLENTETSAIGRALANLGFTASRQRPSQEEMDKAERARARRRDTVPPFAARTSVREESPRYGSDSMHYTHAVADLLTLLSDAERAGLRTDRAQQLRDRLARSPRMLPERICETERWLRRWLDHHVRDGLDPPEQ